MLTIESTRAFVEAFLAADAELCRAAALATTEDFHLRLKPAHDAAFFGPEARNPQGYHQVSTPEEREKSARRVRPRRVFRRDRFETDQGAIIAIVTGEPIDRETSAAAYKMRFFIGDTPDGPRIVARDQYCFNCSGVGCDKCDRGWMHFGPEIGFWGPKLALGEPVETVREARPSARYLPLWER